MKIALVVPGGVDRSAEYRVIPVILALIARLALRHEVHVFALAQEPEPGGWDLLGARIHNLGSPFSRQRAIRAICAEHRSSAFHLVHSIWSAAPGLIAVAAARILQRPSIVHVAGGELVALAEIGYGGRLGWRGRLREAMVLRAATVVTAASDPMVSALSQLGVLAKRVPFGVDLDVWVPREPAPRDRAQPARLLHVASLNRVKDQVTLLRALRLLSDSGVSFEMDVVGEDTLQGEIQALSVSLDLTSKVRFHGFLTQRQMLPLVQQAHVLVMSSRHDAGPLAVLEAASQGVPTVGTAVGHIAEWAPHAASAVPVGDASAMAGAIVRLLSDENLRLCVAREAFQRAVTEDADHTARTVQALYDSIACAGTVHADVPRADAGS